MTNAKAFVRTRLVELQRRVTQLSAALTQERERYVRRERELGLDLLEIADAFDNLDGIIHAKEEQLDKSARRLVGNFRAIHRKFLRHLEACHVVPIELTGRQATMEHCEVVETQDRPGESNATILAVLESGYTDPRDGRVIRKAQVITVRNAK